MIQFGQTLKAAREAKGLTIPQVAETTKLMSSVIEGLENEDFSRIVVPIYGRGFVKLYCEAVGLEPKPMVDAFMEIFNAKNAPKTEHKAEPPPPTAEPKKNKDILTAKAAVLRFGALGIAAILILLLLACGIRALYRATSTNDEQPEAKAPTAETTTPAAPRTPIPIDPLYMD